MSDRFIVDMYQQIKFKPIKLGICVNTNNYDSIIRAMQINFSLWGGLYNPLIPYNDSIFADNLIKAFNVDVLINIEKDNDADVFIAQYTHLPWPFDYKTLFYRSYLGDSSFLLDITSPLREYTKENGTIEASQGFPKTPIVIYSSKDQNIDNLCTVALGKYPSKEKVNIDYYALLSDYLIMQDVESNIEKALSDNYNAVMSPAKLTTYGLHANTFNGLRENGIYFGNIKNGADIVHFWNLRASGIKIHFYDKSYKSLYGNLIEKYRTKTNRINKMLYGDETQRFEMFYLNEESFEDYLMEKGEYKSYVSPILWNGLNIKPSDYYITNHFLQSNIIQTKYGEKCLIQVPINSLIGQQSTAGSFLICEINSFTKYSDSIHRSFAFPHYPHLNTFLGEKYYLQYRHLRTSTFGQKLIVPASTNYLNIYSVNVAEYIVEVFKKMGIRAEISKAGLIAMRIIDQFGGIQGCRVFKMQGVRDFMMSSNPDKEYAKAHIIEKINEAPLDGKNNKTIINFSNKYSDLHFEGRSFPNIIPEDVFNHLVNRSAFRVGKTFLCENCNMEFWTELDNICTFTKCSYCGHPNNILLQIENKRWGYRRSGIFGKGDNQEGAIPVVATLQQLDTTIHSDHALLFPSLKLKLSALKKEIEIDLLYISQEYNKKPEMVIGECKSKGGGIEENDISNLLALANTIDSDYFKVYILISKMSDFTQEDIAFCKKINLNSDYRAILLTNNEIEPYFIYSRTAVKHPQIDKHANTLYQLAVNTHKIYFENG